MYQPHCCRAVGVIISQLAISTFNNNNKFLYPKTKSHLLTKYFNGTKFDSGDTVWDLFDNGNLKAIEKRTRKEVLFTHKCYKKINFDFG